MNFDNGQPIFQQVADMIENDIITGVYHEEDQVISVSQFVRTFEVNPATVVKGINLLVSEGILYKKRGLGMFVAVGAKDAIVRKRIDNFREGFLIKLLDEAEKLGISKEDLIDMIRREQRG